MPKATRLAILRWRKRVAVLGPASVSGCVRSGAGQKIKISRDEDGVMVKPVGGGKLTLVERLALFEPGVHGGEAVVAGLVGGEVF